MSGALDRLETWPRPIRWPAKVVLNVGGIVVGSGVFVIALAGTLIGITIVTLFARALWRAVFG